MGWRDRDWAKFHDNEIRSLLGSSPAPFGGRRRTTAARGLARGATLLAVAVSAVAIVFITHLNELGKPGHTAARLLTPAPRIVEPQSDVIAIRWRTSDTAPASHGGRICVTDSRHGRICASYVVGERPADTLTRRIESLGLRVQSSG